MPKGHVNLLWKKQRRDANRERNKRHRASESEAKRTHHLAIGQQREAYHRASESETQHTQRIAAGQ